jgi:hypothetical protein
MATYAQIADFYNITIDYIISGIKCDETLSTEDERIQHKLKNLTIKEKLFVIEFLESLENFQS